MIEVKIYRRHEILNDIIKSVAAINEGAIPVRKDDMLAFLKIFILLYPPLYDGIIFADNPKMIVVAKQFANGPHDIICELKFPVQ